MKYKITIVGSDKGRVMTKEQLEEWYYAEVYSKECPNSFEEFFDAGMDLATHDYGIGKLFEVVEDQD